MPKCSCLEVDRLTRIFCLTYLFDIIRCRANLSPLKFHKVSGLSPSGANPLYVHRPVCLTTFPVKLLGCS